MALVFLVTDLVVMGVGESSGEIKNMNFLNNLSFLQEQIDILTTS